MWAGGCRRIRWSNTLSGRRCLAPADGIARPGEAHRTRLRELASYPTPFQAHVPGVGIVLGEEVYARGIVSDANDDRYATRQGDVAEITPNRPRAASRSPARPASRSPSHHAPLGGGRAFADRRIVIDHFHKAPLRPRRSPTRYGRSRRTGGPPLPSRNRGHGLHRIFKLLDLPLRRLRG